MPDHSNASQINGLLAIGRGSFDQLCAWLKDRIKFAIVKNEANLLMNIGFAQNLLFASPTTEEDFNPSYRFFAGLLAIDFNRFDRALDL